MLMATCCEDDIVQWVLPFVKDNIRHADWRFRDAAVMAFGMYQVFVLLIPLLCQFPFFLYQESLRLPGF